jgi:phosphatidylglycerophosphate synthase
MGGLHIMRLKPKWRGTIIVVLSMIAYYAIFYGSEDRNSSTTKTWLWAIFAVGFFGGVLAFVDSLVLLRRGKKQGNKDVQEK